MLVQGYPKVSVRRPHCQIPEMLFSGLGSLPASIHRFSVDRPMPSFLASSVPLTYLCPATDARLACIPFARHSSHDSPLLYGGD